MRNLHYSKSLKRVVEVQNELTADEALQVLVDELLGTDYYIVDPMHAHQANVIIVEDILRKYKRRSKWRKT